MEGPVLSSRLSKDETQSLTHAWVALIKRTGIQVFLLPSSKANGQHWREVAVDGLVLLGSCQLVNSMDSTTKKN
jgi:hypothetical protein